MAYIGNQQPILPPSEPMVVSIKKGIPVRMNTTPRPVQFKNAGVTSRLNLRTLAPSTRKFNMMPTHVRARHSRHRSRTRRLRR
jgi:hypothetical protein